MRWPRSLYGQLLLSQLLLLAVVALAMPAVTLFVLQRTADDFVEARLSHDADVIATAIARDPRVTPAAILEQLGPLYSQRGATRGYKLIGPAGRVEFAGGAIRSFPSLVPTGSARFATIGDLDIHAQKIRRDGGWARIEVAQDRTRPEVIVDDVVNTFLRRSWWIIPAMLVLSALVGMAVTRRLTSMLRDASRQADAIGPERLHARVDPSGLPDEVCGLVTATNRALDRVEAGYRQQSAFVASVAHELRTPLALVTLRCDALHPSTERDALRTAADQAAHVVAQLMELASIEGRPPVIEPFVVTDVVRAVVAELAPLVYRSGRSIEAIDSDNFQSAVGNAGLLRVALTNLIDNAIRHTSAGTHIVVSCTEDAVIVADDGPGVIVERDAEGEPRIRGVGSRRSDSAGLGLSIVRRIMTAMGGELVLDGEAGGACFKLVLQPFPRR